MNTLKQIFMCSPFSCSSVHLLFAAETQVVETTQAAVATEMQHLLQKLLHLMRLRHQKLKQTNALSILGDLFGWVPFYHSSRYQTFHIYSSTFLAIQICYNIV